MEGGCRSCADGQPFPDRGEGCLGATFQRTTQEGDLQVEVVGSALPMSLLMLNT